MAVQGSGPAVVVLQNTVSIEGKLMRSILVWYKMARRSGDIRIQRELAQKAELTSIYI